MKGAATVKSRVLIIGAGAAGIASCQTLVKGGIDLDDIVILEARDRIGGRVCQYKLTENLLPAKEQRAVVPLVPPTDCSPSGERSVNIQIGANWLHGLDENVNPLYAYATAKPVSKVNNAASNRDISLFCPAGRHMMNLSVSPTSCDSEPGDDVILYDCGDTADGSGTVVSQEMYENVLARFFWMMENLSGDSDDESSSSSSSTNSSGSIGGLDGDVSLETAVLRRLAESEFVLSDDASCRPRFGSMCPIERRCLQWCIDRLAIDVAASIDKVSLCYYDDAEDDGTFGEGIPHGGMFQILENMVHHQYKYKVPTDGRDADGQDVLESDGTILGRIRLEHVVTRVSSTMDVVTPAKASGQVDGESSCHYVTVSCLSGAVFEAEYVICTLPVGNLLAGDVLFSSSLCDLPYIARQGRMDVDYGAEATTTEDCNLNPYSPLSRQLLPGLMNLVYLWYPHSFWPEGINFLAVTRSTDSASATFPIFLIPPAPLVDNLGAPAHLLMAQLAGPYAYKVEEMSNEEIAAEATGVLRRMFANSSDFHQHSSSQGMSTTGTVVPDPIGCCHSSWHSDVYARGSYSYYTEPVAACCESKTTEELSVTPISGETTITYQKININEGRQCISRRGNVEDDVIPLLVFAGEATCDNDKNEHQATVHGAYISGVREGLRILQALGKK